MRDSSRPPPELPEPPASWTTPFAAMAAELGLSATDTEHAWTTVAATYHRTLSTIDGETIT